VQNFILRHFYKRQLCLFKATICAISVTVGNPLRPSKYASFGAYFKIDENFFHNFTFKYVLRRKSCQLKKPILHSSYISSLYSFPLQYSPFCKKGGILCTLPPPPHPSTACDVTASGAGYHPCFSLQPIPVPNGAAFSSRVSLRKIGRVR